MPQDTKAIDIPYCYFQQLYQQLTVRDVLLLNTKNELDIMVNRPILYNRNVQTPMQVLPNTGDECNPGCLVLRVLNKG